MDDEDRRIYENMSQPAHKRTGYAEMMADKADELRKRNIEDMEGQTNEQQMKGGEQ